MREKCPKCGQDSLTKRPESKIMRDSWGSEVNIANTYSIICMNPNCKHIVETIRENTEFGNKLEKPWYKRLF